MTNFWKGQLIFKREYTGNPNAKHKEVDYHLRRTITSEQSGLRINIWYDSIVILFDGNTAYIAKNRAQKLVP